MTSEQYLLVVECGFIVAIALAFWLYIVFDIKATNRKIKERREKMEEARRESQRRYAAMLAEIDAQQASAAAARQTQTAAPAPLSALAPITFAPHNPGRRRILTPVTAHG